MRAIAGLLLGFVILAGYGAAIAQVPPNVARQAPAIGGATQAAAIANASELVNAHARKQAEYADSIRRKIRSHILVPQNLPGNPEVEVAVEQDTDGTVVGFHLLRSSGVPALDRALEQAVFAASPLPLPANQQLFRRHLRLKYRPYEA